MYELRKCALEHGLNIVDIVGYPREDIAALVRIEVAQRKMVDLLLHILTQGEDHPHYQAVEQPTLPPHEERGAGVERDHDCDEASELREVDTLAGNHVCAGEHIRVRVAAVRSSLLDDGLDR